VEQVESKSTFTKEPSPTRGRYVRPVFHHKSGWLENVWFSNGVAVPTVLYDACLGLLDGLTFTCHAGCAAIHVRHKRKVIGFIWPCSIWAPEVVSSAQAQLKARMRSPKTGLHYN
jgi:hypothetical protein